MSEGAGQPLSRLVQAAGWEMHCSQDGSDKYYRIVLAGSTVIVNWGRTGAAGGLKVHAEPNAAAARAQALRLTSEKEARGYRLVRATTVFPAAASLVDLARSGGGTQDSTEATRSLVDLFIQASETDQEGRR